MKAKHVLKVKDKHLKVRCADYNSDKQILIVGTKDGSFQLIKIEKEDIQILQELLITNCSISSVCLNLSGNWIGMGIKEIG